MEKGKARKLVGRDKVSLVTEAEKEENKARVAKEITHHQLTDAHTVPEQRLLWKNSLQVVLLNMTSKAPLTSWGQLSQLCRLPASCPPPAYWPLVG